MEVSPLPKISSKRPSRLKSKTGFLLSVLWLSGSLNAAPFQWRDGEVRGSLDTTLSFGQLWRLESRDLSNDDMNGNDGNRNFNKGLVSQVFKINSDLQARYKNMGVFVRGVAFYDTQIIDKRNDYLSNNQPFQPSQTSPQSNRFTKATRNEAGHHAELLDAYIYGHTEIANLPITARLGNQVFNWGETQFYRGGLNSVSAINAAKFRLPGAEIKEVLLPAEAISLNIGLSQNLSLETFYQWNWEETTVDPVGTYFSETDLFADGGRAAYNRQPALIPLKPLYDGLSQAQVGGLKGGANIDSAGNIKVSAVDNDVTAKDSGQFGLSLRFIAEQLNSTEFAFYFVNYHGKEPTIYADINNYQALNLSQISSQVALGITPQVKHAVANSANISVSDLDAVLANNALNPALAAAYYSALSNQAATATGGIATLDVANHIVARREYTEDIQLYGLSMNTSIGKASLFGEIAYRPNLPIGISASDDLVGDLLQQAVNLVNNGHIQLAAQQIDITGHIHNVRDVESVNASIGSIINLGPFASFHSAMLMAEVASEHIHGDNLKYLAFNGDTRYVSGRANKAYVSGYEDGDQITRDAYGYTLLFTGTWNDVYSGLNVSPFAVFKHDFKGNSHQTGNFIDGRKAHTLGLRANYLRVIDAEIQYTAFYGAGRNNGLRDRDNIGMSVKYAF